MIKNITALIAFVLITSSCSIYHINSVDSGDTFYPAKAIDEVVYLEEITEDHQIIGTVTVNGERKQRNIDDVIIKMKREAAILGGDAITDIQSDATGVWKRLPVQQTIGNAYIRANYTAAVVIFGPGGSPIESTPAIKENTVIEEDVTVEEDTAVYEDVVIEEE